MGEARDGPDDDEQDKEEEEEADCEDEDEDKRDEVEDREVVGEVTCVVAAAVAAERLCGLGEWPLSPLRSVIEGEGGSDMADSEDGELVLPLLEVELSDGDEATATDWLTSDCWWRAT